MTLLKAIDTADKLRPNAIDKYEKIKWVYELEGEVAELMGIEADLMLTVPEQSQTYDDEDLLMHFPHDNIYALFVMAKIDLALDDTTLYQNDMIVFNAALSDAKRWWFKTKGYTKRQSVKTI